eukprot:TRINITY_DN47254_c0_g1_i1.p1 TRINITY_DN47254_c0_g1~~TRINITY_DN47254_c0_g1_i1.p1  ORF type:complete len:108 (-),score=14.79 TRINITY_DN47254_c0_g1_i1:54-347(-)
MIDLTLLGLCDALVTSVHSTFGYVAQSLAGVRPYVLTETEAAAPLVSRRCYRASSPAPCFHSGKALLTEPPDGIGFRWREQALQLREPFGLWGTCRF